MRHTPTALMLTVAGIVGLITAHHIPSLILGITSGIVILVGMIWFSYGWDRMEKDRRKLRREMDRLTADVLESDVLIRAANRKAGEAKEDATKAKAAANEARAEAKDKRTVKGFVKNGDRIINFERKEA